jgi:hypothetical protein
LVGHVFIRLPSTTGLAAWSATGTGSAGEAATVIRNGLASSGSANGTSVTLRWPAATFPAGTLVGYVINRNAINGATGTAGDTPAGVVTTTTRTDSPASRSLTVVDRLWDVRLDRVDRH